jgi:hypothetical protein
MEDAISVPDDEESRLLPGGRDVAVKMRPAVGEC